MPNDPTLHEFRALVFFALGQYDAAAATLYPVLSAGPGWDWTTLVGLYPSVDVYTAQLRALEDDSRANPGKASDHFVLAYQYLTEGFPENAANELRQVAQLQPKDTLSARLLAQITAAARPRRGRRRPARRRRSPSAASNGPRGEPGRHLDGQADARQHDHPVGRPRRQFRLDRSPTRTAPASSTAARPTATTCSTLAPSTGDPLVGRVTWTDPEHFNFQAVGGGAGDPGLAFQKTGG